MGLLSGVRSWINALSFLTCVSSLSVPPLEQRPTESGVWGTDGRQEQADLLHLPEGVQEPACPQRPHAVPRGHEGLPQPQTGEPAKLPPFQAMCCLLCFAAVRESEVSPVRTPGEAPSFPDGKACA